jgi:type IX secretion system PorP/SprF family membrane protein
MKKVISFLFVLTLSINIYAQQDVQFTHYMYNTLSVNPAYSGTNGMLNASLLHRQQWIGFDGAPVTQTLFVHSPIVSENMGVGLSMVNDRVGPIRQTSVSGSYAYHVKTSLTGTLSLGLSASANMIQANLTTLKTDQANDLAFAANPANNAAPNFGFGAYYHSQKWYIGASVPKLLETRIENPNATKLTRLVRHYYIIGGYVFEVNKDIKLKPAFLTKLTANAPVSVDLSLEAYYKDKVSAGIMNRFGDSFGLLAGYQLTNQLRAGVSYDYSTSRLVNYNRGTVEVFMSFNFVFNKEKTITPRYF